MTVAFTFDECSWIVEPSAAVRFMLPGNERI